MKLPPLPSIFDVYREGKSVAKAAKHQHVAALGAGLGLLIATLATIAKGYGLDLSFITPEAATQLGLVLAGACGLHYHYGTSPERGLPGLARPPGDAAASGDAPAAAPVGSGPADARAPDPVRPGRPQATGPTGDFMP